MAETSRKEDLAASLPEEWRSAFCRLVETGEAEKAFLEFLESNEAAQAVVEIAFNEQAAALERLGAMLHASKTKMHEIGAIETTGGHKGEVYGGIFPDGKPGWILAAPKLMDHFDAVAWATEHGGALPTRKQGDYLDTIKDQGAFKEIFNRGGPYFPAGYVWLAEPGRRDGLKAWCQEVRSGDQYDYDYYGYLNFRTNELPVLCVRR